MHEGGPLSAVARGARGGSVTIAGQVLKALLKFFGAIILSRLLPPEDFGLVAMVTVLVAFGELLRDVGLSTSALRAPTLTQQQASNMLWLNTLLGLFTAVLLAAATPLLVTLYDEPRLAAITPVLAICLALNGLQSQVRVQMARNHQYTGIAVTDLISQIFGYGVAIYGAAVGWGYWALVWQPLVTAVTLLIMRFGMARWVPSWPRRRANTKDLVLSGINFGATDILGYFASNTDTMMIGAVWGATPLGYYNRAYQLITMPVTSMLAPLTNVVVPTVNAARKAGNNIERLLLRIQGAVGFGTTFVFAVTAASSDVLIPFVLGENWVGSIGITQILALGGAAQAFYQVAMWAFITEGSSRQMLRCNLVTRLLTVALVVGGTFISVEGAAWAYSISLAVSWPISLWWLKRSTSLKAHQFLGGGVRTLLVGAASSLPVMFLTVPGGAYWLQTLIKAAIAGVLFVGLTALSRGGRQDLRSLVAVVSRSVRGV